MSGPATDVPVELTIERLREAYIRGDLTPEAVVRQLIERAEADAAMNIWITPPRMERIRPYLERLREKSPAELPLWGVPFAIKDNIDLAGVPTTAACPDYQYVPSVHATVVERLIEAGAIPLGKTNMDQFATGLVGTRSPYGETHNALKPELISGGSSSGSAVAVARGHAVFALGTDTAGSGRVPAALNGIVGYKPRLGAWPTKGVVPACASLDCVTVFARRMSDAWAVDQVVRGYEAADPWSADCPAPVSRRPAKLCLPKTPPAFFGPYAAEYAAAWERAVERLKGLSIETVEVDTGVFNRAAALLYDGPYVEERRAALGDFIESHPGSTLPVTEQIIQSGKASNYDAASLFRAMHAMRAMKREASLLLEGAVLALPTVGGTWTRDEVRAEPIAANSALGLYTNHCNLLDLCAAALPAGDAADGVPFGITFFTTAEQEPLLRGAADIWLDEPGCVSTASPKPGHTFVAVCGLHMRGLPLEKQMKACGAVFLRADRTAPSYRFYKLPTEPAKPGLVKQTKGGASIELEVWEMPESAFGAFAAAIPAPLGIGKVELADGSQVPGFVCEAYAADGAEDITACGSWRAVLGV